MQLNTVLRSILIWGIYLIPFIPTVVATSLFFPFITGKNFIFRFLVEILFGAWILLALRDSTYRPRFSWILGALAAFVALISLADIFGENFPKSFWSNYERMEGLITHLHLFAYFLIVVSVFTKEDLWRRFFHISMGVSIFIIIYGILQLAGEFVINQGGVRLDGTLGNATYLAVYMLFHIFLTLFWAFRSIRFKAYTGDILVSCLVGFGLFALWSFVRAGNPGIALGPYEKGLLLFSLFAFSGLVYLYIKYRNNAPVHYVLYTALLLSQTFILYHTATRGALLGFVGGTLVTTIALLFFKRESRGVRRIAAGAGIALVLMSGTLFLFRDTAYVRESQVLGRMVNISFSDAESRFFIWNMSFQGFKERPLLGWGQDNFSLVFNKYYDPKMYKQEPWFDRAHNIVFDWLVAAGLLGLLAYLSIFAAILYYLFFKRHEEIKETIGIRKPKGETSQNGTVLFSPAGRSLFLGLCAAYFFQNLFVFDQIVSYILFFSVLAFIHTEAVSGQFKEEHTLRHAINPIRNHIIAPVFVMICTPVLLYAVNADGYFANRTLLRGMTPQQGGPEKNFEYFERALAYDSFGNTEIREQLTQFAINFAGAQVPQELKDKISTRAQSEMKKQVEGVPRDARNQLFLAMILLSYGEQDAAIEVLKTAVEISPKKQQIYYLLANAHLAQDKLKSALGATQIAFELEPSNEEARKYYAVAAIFAGEDKLADELLSLVTKQPIDRLFIHAYAKRGQWGKLAEMLKKRIEEEPSEPGNLENRISLAAAYVELGDRKNAISVLEEAIRTHQEFKEQGEYFIKEIRAGRKP